MTDPWAMPDFQNSIVLADGTELKGRATLVTEADNLWVYLDEGNDFSEAFQLFSDPEKTKKIVSHTSILLTEEWEGYTKMTLIKQDGAQISIRMQKGALV